MSSYWVGKLRLLFVFQGNKSPGKPVPMETFYVLQEREKKILQSIPNLRSSLLITWAHLLSTWQDLEKADLQANTNDRVWAHCSYSITDFQLGPGGYSRKPQGQDHLQTPWFRAAHLWLLLFL